MDTATWNEYAWQTLCIIGTLCLIAEVFMPSFLMAPVGLAFFASAIAPLLTPKPHIHFLVLTLNLVVIFFVFRKWVRPRLINRPVLKSNFEALVGSTATVTESIEPHKNGYVKLYSDTWVAVTDNNISILKGEMVRITKVEGNHVKVEKLKE